ncbi:Os01g0613300 [Oryza sativa Japonica Group]|uniref:Os01g0613300 protein n=9 Tax=Oryza TaxID=4527 RepID=Q0JLA3_ORYSJ|nr:hypothetical protein EE612_004041 [Oryza sativa]BAF05475.1 Os01g0613300 [Oryza sativa Japonica Group]BAG88359.1 unnamed protein product [Oryza sativa Japonica Group]BAS73139.1 Os01g0613300 [Oryza sativa Japonica Group]|eukprot:NP_001043561.1 Os01g0613300 [Oryza sativa Japonica Group]
MMMMMSAASSPSCLLLLPRPTKPTPPLLPSTSSCRRPPRCRIRSLRPENPAPPAAGVARAVASSSSPMEMEAAQTQACGGGEGQQEAMRLLFVEMGVGYDQHGQDVTAAAVRACRDAITSNSIPAFRSGSIPGVNTEQMKLQIKLGVPRPTQHLLDVERVKAVFPYGKIISFEVVDGGMICSSGVCLEAMGDKNDDCYIVNAAVYVGY